MSNKKLKMTPLARFFVFLLICAPIAYFGASYLNEGNGLEDLKKMIGVGEEKKEVSNSIQESDEAILGLEDCEKRVRELEKELAIKNALIQEMNK